MANLRRRSARLNKADTRTSSVRKTPVSNAQLGSLVERDETPDNVQHSLNEVLSTPTASRTIHEHLSQLNGLRTPQTQPKLEQAEMNPKTVHRSTTKAPDSGLKLGFSDIIKDKKNDTPSKSATRQSETATPMFEFQFSSDSNLSRNAQKLMENVREDAARIKAQMVAEKAAQENKDQAANQMFGAGRKIAMPKGKAGRFSDVHMAQFKKMDSIENHASAFRARPGFAVPTVQSLKRSPSKAGLDEPERPRTAGKAMSNQPRRISPPVTGRALSVSPFKSVPAAEPRGNPGAAKRMRHSEHQDVSDVRLTSALPRPKTSSLYSPTKASLARSSQRQLPEKPSMLPRSNSVRSTKAGQIGVQTAAQEIPSAKPPVSKPLPPLPSQQEPELYPRLPQSPSKSLSTGPGASTSNFTSRLPTLAGIKSILRGNRKTDTIIERPGTPKRPNTAILDTSSTKKVDFTPSVKSRHAVKLAASSPSPAKIRRDTPYKASEPVFPYDPSAYIIEDDGDQDWEDEDGEVLYPTLPPAENSPSSVEQNFSTKAREFNKRESREFKSIFTTLHPTRTEAPATLTSVNTLVNKTNPEVHVSKVMRSPGNLKTKPSPSTIRRVSGSGVTDVIQPFEDQIKTVPHGLPGKKRRHESTKNDDKYGTDEDAKENRIILEMPAVPGGWDDTELESADSEDNARSSKRVRTSMKEAQPAGKKNTSKKPNAAREAAAKNAKDRKSRGALSLSRLNMLSRPKTRG